MRVDDFSFYLPEELIAQEPLADRSQSRMLVVHRKEGRWEDRCFREFPSFLHPDDCVILNDSRVFPSRLYARRAGGTAAVEVFLLRRVGDDPRMWEALVRPGRKVPVGERLLFDGGLEAEVLVRREHGERTLRFSSDPDLETIGHVPLPPYIRRSDRAEDRERYQTVYARHTGSIAAPTAGLHFTPEMLALLQPVYVTLHVGLGTFAPLRSETVEENVLHTERYSITPEAMETIRRAARRIAVGTTAVRTLETAYRTGQTQGETNIFIYPRYEFQAIDALLTNFHLPRSSLIMLVAAFAGTELTLAAYEHAVRERYRFFSYGDCMLVVE